MSKIKYSQDMFDEDKFYGKKRNIWTKIFLTLLVIYISALVIFLGLYINFKNHYELVPVKGMSMQPTLNPKTTIQDDCDDWVYIKKKDAYTTGDIVIFDSQEGDCLIKRVIATQNDLVTIRLVYSEKLEMEVYTVCVVHSKDINEDGSFDDSKVDYLEEDYTTSAYKWTTSPLFQPTIIAGVSYENRFATTMLSSGNYDITIGEDGVRYAKIPEGQFFYLGDNRLLSSDSRHRGTDKIESITGAVEIIVPNANDSSTLLIQIKYVFSYYGDKIGQFFSSLWSNLEKSFAI